MLYIKKAIAVKITNACPHFKMKIVAREPISLYHHKGKKMEARL